MSFWTESRSWFKIQGVRPSHEQIGGRARGLGFCWREPSDGSLSAHLFQGNWQRFICASPHSSFPPFSGGGHPVQAALVTVMSDPFAAMDREALLLLGALSGRDRMSLRLMHCLCRGIWPSNLHKPFSILVHFLDIAMFPIGSNLSTSFLLGARKHCSTLIPLPGKTDLTFRNFCLIFFLF